MPVPASRFSGARNAVWDAIDNWPAFNTPEGHFVQKYRYDSKARGRSGPTENPMRRRVPTSISECRAIAILPNAFPSTWTLNQTTEINYSLSVQMWARSLHSDEIEWLFETLMDAVWGSKAGGAAQSYIRTFLRGGIPTIGPFTTAETILGPVPDNGEPVLTITGTITLPIKYQPTNHLTS